MMCSLLAHLAAYPALLIRATACVIVVLPTSWFLEHPETDVRLEHKPGHLCCALFHWRSTLTYPPVLSCKQPRMLLPQTLRACPPKQDVLNGQDVSPYVRVWAVWHALGSLLTPGDVCVSGRGLTLKKNKIGATTTRFFLSSHMHVVTACLLCGSLMLMMK